VITDNGGYYLTNFDLTAHFDQNYLRIEKFNSEKVWSLAMWNADLGYYYGKRFLFDAQFKQQNMLGDNADSKIVVLSDREEAKICIKLKDESKPDIEVLMSDFIDVKSPKAKGKRFTIFDVEKIEDITPEPESLPEEDEALEINQEKVEQVEDDQTKNTLQDVTFTISNDFPEDSKPVDDQLTLF
jgi:topoisomerase-4 subunit A